MRCVTLTIKNWTGASRAFVAGALLILLAIAGRAHAIEPPPPWMTTGLKPALEAARVGDKPVLAMFSAAWCEPCTKMKKDVLSQKEVQQALASWVCVYLDEAIDPGLLEQYKIEVFPTFVIMNSKGEEQVRLMGGMPAEDFIKALEAFKKYSKRRAELDAAIAKTPQNPALWKERGDLLSGVGKVEAALEAYRKSQSLDPKDAAGAAADIYFLDSLQLMEKDPKEGHARLSKFEQLYPKSPRIAEALFVRALMAMDEDQLGEAKRLLTDYLKRFPNEKRKETAEKILKEIADAGEQKAK